MFPVSLIAESLSELGYANITAKELEEQKGTKSVVHGIKILLNKNAQQELDKPALAETIARKVAVDKNLLPPELKELFVALGLNA